LVFGVGVVFWFVLLRHQVGLTRPFALLFAHVFIDAPNEDLTRLLASLILLAISRNCLVYACDPLLLLLLIPSPSA